MNIWLICQYYKPEPGAPSARLSGFAHVWQNEGHKVTVLTAIPNHPKGIIPADYQGRGRYFSEKIDGVEVWRHNLYVTPNEGFIKKARSHLSFAFSLLRKNFLRTKQKPDVIIVSSPAFFAAISAWLLSVRYRVPFVMEVRDLWPGIFVELGVMKKGVLLSLLEKIELFLYRRAKAVVTVTNGFAKDIAERKINPSKIFVITNGVADTELETAANIQNDNHSTERLRNELQISPFTKVVLYIGTHGGSQALGQVIDAARILMNRGDILFLLVGDGADKARLQKLAKSMPNVQFLGSQPKKRVWQFYNMAYINLVPLKDIPGFATFIPSKMFEIMAAGKVSVGCVAGEAAEILQESRGAIVVPPEQPEKLARAIVGLVDSPERAEKMGNAARDFVGKKYRHSLLAKQYLGILNRVTAPKKSKKEK